MSDSQRSLSARRPSLPERALIDQRYVVEGLLGRGGMGYVYKVRDTASGREVALKRMRTSRERGSAPSPFHADSAVRGRKKELPGEAARRAQRLELFQREFHTLAELAHPRIIEVYDYGWDQDAPYYTMEMLTGSDMGALSPMPWRRACAVLRDVASALTLVHSRRLLHRDISPSNVHQLADGSCKLIDFGALSTMGKAKAIVGTPPFMAPELLQHGVLDARSDLYSLGALGYYLVTGRTVHPVRTLAELHNYIGARPTAPSAHVQDLPKALDELLLQLVSPLAAGRPPTTIDVIERLSGIDGVEHERALAGGTNATSRLVTPAFVGREAELRWVRRRLTRARRGKGRALLVSAARGAGRSRFLDACVLQARLTGTRALRAEPDGPGAAPYALVGDLLRQLQNSFGTSELEQLPLPPQVARALFPELTGEAARSGSARPLPETGSASARSGVSLHEPLLDYFAKVAARRCLLIAVDNLERADAQSAALLSALALRARAHSMVVIATVHGEDGTSLPEHVHAFKTRARELSLSPLSEAQVAALLGSVFGDVPNLGILAPRLHALASGNARLCVELAQHLCDSGVIRCESGGYLLPEVFSDRDLPSNLSAALQARVHRLSREARALGACLSACTGSRLVVEESFSIAELGDAGTGSRALEELSAAHMVDVRNGGVCLRQPELVDALLETLSGEERRALHARAAALLVRDEARKLHAAEQFFHAEQPLSAIDALLSAATTNRLGMQWHPGYRALVERGLSACQQFARSARDVFTLQHALAEHVLNYNEDCQREQLLQVSHTLWQLSGLADWEALGSERDPGVRLKLALARAQTRYEQLPAHERIMPPAAAIQTLVMYQVRVAGFASTSLNIELLYAVPSLRAFAPLGPGIALHEELVAGLRDLRAGRTERYVEAIEGILERLAQPDSGGFPPALAQSFRVNLVYGLALAGGAQGREVAFAYASEMESVRSQVINAWRARQLAHLFLCDPAAAELCRREVELMQIAQPSRQFHQGGTVETEAFVYAQADDLLGLRRVLPAIERMAAVHAGWQPVLLVARAALQRVRGRFGEALQLYTEALSLAPLGRHMQWSYAAGGQLQTLVELGRAQEARELGLQYLAGCEKYELASSSHRIEIPLADAECLLGHHARATARVERMIDEALDVGMRGLLLGILYETGARCALSARDSAAFDRYYAAALQHLPEGRYAGITARMNRLLDAARRASMAPTYPSKLPADALSPGTVKAKLAACEPDQKSARALELVMAATGASEGHLYHVVANGLVLCASSQSSPPPSHLSDFLQRFLASDELQRDQTVDLTYATSVLDPESALEPVPLLVEREGERTVVAIAALTFALGRRWPNPELLDAIANELCTDNGELISI
jgi:hypothetical protein